MYDMFATLRVSNDERSRFVRDPQNLNMYDMFATLRVSNDERSKFVRDPQ